jgi:hypothetical protein
VTDYPRPTLLEDPGEIVESLDHNRWTWYEWECPLGGRCTVGFLGRIRTNKSSDAQRWRSEHVRRHKEQVEYLERQVEEDAHWAPILDRWNSKPGYSATRVGDAAHITYTTPPSRLSLWWKRMRDRRSDA